MPGQDGIEFLESVRAIDEKLPFILFTGKGSEEVASEAISAGVTDYLQKHQGTDQYTMLANRSPTGRRSSKLELALSSMVLTFIIALPLGVISGPKAMTWADNEKGEETCGVGNGARRQGVRDARPGLGAGCGRRVNHGPAGRQRGLLYGARYRDRRRRGDRL